MVYLELLVEQFFGAIKTDKTDEKIVNTPPQKQKKKRKGDKRGRRKRKKNEDKNGAVRYREEGKKLIK